MHIKAVETILQENTWQTCMTHERCKNRGRRGPLWLCFIKKKGRSYSIPYVNWCRYRNDLASGDFPKNIELKWLFWIHHYHCNEKITGTQPQMHRDLTVVKRIYEKTKRKVAGKRCFPKIWRLQFRKIMSLPGPLHKFLRRWKSSILVAVTFTCSAMHCRKERLIGRVDTLERKGT